MDIFKRLTSSYLFFFLSFFQWSFLISDPLLDEYQDRIEYSFDDLQKCTPEILATLPPVDQANYIFYKNNFEKNYHPEVISTELKIPQVIHFIWLGPNSFPIKSIPNIRSWARVHPGWKIKFWTDDPLRPCPIDGMETHLINELDLGELALAYKASKNPAQKSDILRYVILQKEGGLYVDHDVLCYHSFNHLNYNYHFYCSLESIHLNQGSMFWVFPSNAIIGAKPDHPVILQTIKNVLNRMTRSDSLVRENKDIFSEVMATTFSSFSSATASHLGKEGNIDMVFPGSFFMSRRFFDNPKELSKLRKQKLSLCEHNFAATWLPKPPNKKTVKDDTFLRKKIKNKLNVLMGISIFNFFIFCYFIFKKKRARVAQIFFIIIFFQPFRLFSAFPPEDFSFQRQCEVPSFGNYIQSTLQLTDEDKEILDRMEQNYNYLIFKISEASLSEPPKIPHVFHFIWLGPSPFPKDSLNRLRIWVDTHSDWKFKFWTDSTELQIPIKGVEKHLISELTLERIGKYIKETKNYGEASDLLRYEILWQEGGIYIDHDVDCLSQLDRVCSQVEFFAGIEPLHEDFCAGSFITVSNAVIGSIPHHPILDDTLEMIDKNWDYFASKYMFDDQFSKVMRVLQRTFVPFTKSVKKNYFNNNQPNLIFPPLAFSVKHVPNWENIVLNDPKGLFIYGNHMWTFSWQDKEKPHSTKPHGLSLSAFNRVLNVLLAISFLLMLVIISSAISAWHFVKVQTPSGPELGKGTVRGDLTKII